MIDSLPGGGLKADEEKQQQAWWDALLRHRSDAGVSFELDLRFHRSGDPQLQQAGYDLCCPLSSCFKVRLG